MTSFRVSPGSSIKLVGFDGILRNGVVELAHDKAGGTCTCSGWCDVKADGSGCRSAQVQ